VIRLLSLLLLLALSRVEGLVQAPPAIKIAPDVASGVYEPGQTVTWTIDVPGGSGKAAYVVRKGGLEELAKGEVELVDGKATVSATRTDPGTLLMDFTYQKTTARGAAAFAPEKIAASAPPPDDFDAFWASKIKELNDVPPNARLEKVDVGDASIEYWKITLDNIRGAKVRGQIAKPAGKSGLPAILQVQWAGVYGLDRGWVTGHAKAGWLSMNILAHDLPIDEKKEFYDATSKKELADYVLIGAEDREQSYFLKMFLSCYRAVDYLTAREDWNKGALVVHGGSQGGYQAIVTAGLHPAVTAFAANVPAGCDHTGKRAKRSPGWPGWTGREWMKRDAAKLEQTGRYFDAMNFAARATAPGLIGVGLVDTVCPSEGVLATVNQLKGPKKVVIMPMSGHGGEGPGHKDYYAVYGGFLDEHKKKAAK
jgi:cephalosporin-C deacetylase-like acetyl esterase